MTTASKPRGQSPPQVTPTGAVSAPYRPITEGLAAALLQSGWILLHDRGDGYPGWSILVPVTLATLLLVRPIKRAGIAGRMWRAILCLALASLVLISAARVLATWEEGEPRFGVASATAAPILNLIGYPAASEYGRLLVEHPDGLITVIPTMEKVAVRSLAGFYALWLALWLARGGPRPIACACAALAVTFLAGLIRFAAILVVYLENDEILVGSSGLRALRLFADPIPTIACLLLAGVAVNFVCRNLVRGAETRATIASPRLRSRVVGGMALIIILSWAGSLAWHFKPPGPEKSGRVLIDDRFCDVWEPTARQLDTEWYGDFSTYSFTSLAEWLGHWHSVDVNTTRPYDDELLSSYDILIIKTPAEAVPASEAAAIERFVQRGGGLLLVGDHTNLLGMGTHLNALCVRHGIRFLYDSISDGVTGGFVRYRAPEVGRPIASLHVDEFEFMTSCSLALSRPAEAVLAVDDCRRDPHDYAGQSFFGRSGAHPELGHGRIVLAATVDVGRGRIAAFTDSTVWSSFAVFQQGHDRLVMDMIRHLNRGTSASEIPLRIAAGAATLLVCLVGIQLARGGSLASVMILGLSGYWGGLVTAEMLHRSIYAWPEPEAPITEVTFLWQGGACAFPPVLGSPGSLPADRSFDTMLVSVQRLGLVPRVAYTYERDFLTHRSRAMVVVAPVNPPPRRSLDRLREFVRRGGHLVVVDDDRIGANGSARDFLAPFGVSITYHHERQADGAIRSHVHLTGGMSAARVPAEDVFCAAKSFGAGKVVYLSNAAKFSRQGMGHCFARPWRDARVRYETIFTLFRDILNIAPTDRRFYGIF